MDFQIVLNEKGINAKAKTELVSQWLLAHPEGLSVLIAYARGAKDPLKAVCVEAIEFATRSRAEIATLELLDFLPETLASKAPRVKMESGRVAGNIARIFPEKLDHLVSALLVNTEDSGTVVRWSAAFALGEIIKLKTPLNASLVPAAENICRNEEKNSIQKIYLAAIKKAQK